jgi:hypothetical protein
LVAAWLTTSAGGAVACMTLDDNKTIGATGADSLMESICTTRNTQIVKIKHDVGALQLPFQLVVRTACQLSDVRMHLLVALIVRHL